MLLTYDNCYSKWQKTWDLLQNTQYLSIIAQNKPAQEVAEMQKRAKPGQLFASVETYPELKTKYTDANSGQKRFGGWSLESLAIYAGYRQKIKAARNGPRGKLFEKGLLEAVRIKLDVKNKSKSEFMNKKAPKDFVSNLNTLQKKALDVLLNSDNEDF